MRRLLNRSWAETAHGLAMLLLRDSLPLSRCGVRLTSRTALPHCVRAMAAVQAAPNAAGKTCVLVEPLSVTLQSLIGYCSRSSGTLEQAVAAAGRGGALLPGAGQKLGCFRGASGVDCAALGICKSCQVCGALSNTGVFRSKSCKTTGTTPPWT